MLYRLRMQQQAQQASSEPLSAAEVATASEQHAKLLAQSDHYFQKALEHLQAPIPFEAKMVAVLDMQTYQVRRPSPSRRATLEAREPD